MFVRQNSHKMKSNATKWVLGHKVTPYETTGDYDLMMAETPPKVQGPPPHFHNSYKESFLIIEGEMEFMVNGEVKTVKAGESVDIPPQTLHTFSNKSDVTCKWINIHSPKGFREFFDHMGVPAHEENAVNKSLTPELINKVLSTAADRLRHDHKSLKFTVPFEDAATGRCKLNLRSERNFRRILRKNFIKSGSFL
jgi:mannose-6-phosphate isomerase-like protein (cupin superfamily)